MRRFKVTCAHCHGTGKDAACDWCNGAGYTVVATDGNVPIGAFEEIHNNVIGTIENSSVIRKR